MRNVLVTGAASPLGHRLLEHLRSEPGLDRIVGVEPEASAGWMDGVELVAFRADHRDLVEFLNTHEIDTVIHCGLAPDRNGSRTAPSEARVIDTMRLGAALSSEGTRVRSWVVASSSAVYPVTSKAPLLHREDGALDASVGTPASSLVEAEEYVRDVAKRAPQVNVSVLRLQQLVGKGIRGPLSAVLQQPVLPSVIGFDASVQLLDIDDAVRALAFSAQLELAGIYNVASAGTIRFSEAVRTLERRALPVLPLEAGPLTPLVRRFGLPHVPDGMLGVLRFGHALDTTKLAAAGFRPEQDQEACLQALRV